MSSWLLVFPESGYQGRSLSLAGIGTVNRDYSIFPDGQLASQVLDSLTPTDGAVWRRGLFE